MPMRAPDSEVRLLKALGHVGVPEDYRDAWTTVEEVLSRRYLAWGDPRGWWGFPPGSFTATVEEP